MYSLTVKGALAYVRKAIDELVSVEEIGMLVSPDAINLHRLVEGSMVEAALRTYAQAPTESLEGVKAEVESDYTLVGIEDGVVTIAFETPIARVLSLRCVDSEIIVNDLIPENSAEGRKQLNKYVQGTYDDPRVVLQKVWNGDNMPILKYYTTTKDSLDDTSFDIEILPYPTLTEGVVQIAARMEFPVLNNIVALVLDSYAQTEIADRFRAKAKEYLES